MKKVIFHVGPGKCGSSSIQNSLSLAHTIPVPFRFSLLDPSLIDQLGSGDYQSATQLFTSAVRNDLRGTDCMVYSHEYAFKVPIAVEAMVRIASDFARSVVVVGYCRKPSSFIQAAYCQWMFRCVHSSREVWRALADIELTPAAFSGLERYLIAAVITDFRTTPTKRGRSTVDWRIIYDEIAIRIAEDDAVLSIGTLPRRNIGYSLLEDFYSRCGLLDGLPQAFLSSEVANTQYDINLVEAIQAAILEGEQLPGPHEDNDFLESASALLKKEIEPDSPFMSLLKARIDTMLWPSNRLFAMQYGLDETAFLPCRNVTAAQAIEAVRNELAERMEHPERLPATRSGVSPRLTRLMYDLYLQGQH